MISFLLNLSKRNDSKRNEQRKAGEAVRSNDIPTKILKDFEDLFATLISKL